MCPLISSSLLDDVMSQSELITYNLNIPTFVCCKNLGMLNVGIIHGMLNGTYDTFVRRGIARGAGRRVKGSAAPSTILKVGQIDKIS